MASKKYLWLAVSLALIAAIIFTVFKFNGNKNSWPGNLAFGSLENLVVSPPPVLIPISADQVQNSTSTKRSFGDGFSGLGYIDQKQTDLFLDHNVTAFSFPPLYDLKKEEPAVGIDNSSNLCLGQGVNKKCLAIKDKIIYFEGQALAWPEELPAESILSVTVGTLSNAQKTKWIIGVVTGQKSDEQGWVYFLNGQDFDPLITKTTTAKIEPKYGRLGGQIYFGGDLDDFLIVYSGYDGRAFYYHQGNLDEVSEFFDLRVAGGGFPAQIIKTTNSRGSLFYVCSLDTNNFKLIKFWSRRPGELAGSIDFSYLLNNDKSKTTGCQFDKNQGTTATSSPAIKIRLGFAQASSTESWIFLDRGFDNSRNRQVTSLDLGQGRSQKIMAAIINQLTIRTDEASSSAALVKLFLANDQSNWQEVAPYNWYEFSQPNHSLYWRAEFLAKPNDANYSPWFSDINELLYKTLD